MKNSIPPLAVIVAIMIAPAGPVAFAGNPSDGSRELKKIKKEIQELQVKYYQDHGAEVMGGDSDEKSYYVKVNTNLPVISMKQLGKIRSSGKNSPSGSHTKSQFSQGGCDNAVKGICNSR